MKTLNAFLNEKFLFAFVHLGIHFKNVLLLYRDLPVIFYKCLKSFGLLKKQTEST